MICPIVTLIFNEHIWGEKCEPDAILLQETWQLPNPQLLNINGNHPLIFKCCNSGSQGGGSPIYLKENILYKELEQSSIFIDMIIETLFVEIEIDH